MSDNDSDSDEQRFWLEASTFSNRGRSLRIVIQAKRAGWKPVPRLTPHCSVWYWLPASGEEHDHNP